MDFIGRSAGRETRVDGSGSLISATIITALALPLTVVTLLQAPGPPLDPGLIAWIAALSVLLHTTGFLCRRAPVAAFIAGSALMLALALTTIPSGSGDSSVTSAAVMPSCAAYLLLVWKMASDGGARSFGALAVGLAGAAIITAVDALRSDDADPLMLLVEAGALAAGIIAAWALGALSRQRRLAESQRAEERVRRAVAEERGRIGRDLHDVVSHSLAVMIAQAEAARVTARDPSADGALERVAETGRSAMQGLRSMLRVLDSPEPEPLEPAPGIDGISSLVDRARSAEHTIGFEVRGRPRPLAPDADLAAYRAAQEALTNAIRHVIAPLSIDVEIEWRETEVEVTVTDDGGQGGARSTGAAGAPGAAGPAGTAGAVEGGTGLIGIAERVERAGGTLEVRRAGRRNDGGRRGDGGWRIRAVLPVEEAP